MMLVASTSAFADASNQPKCGGQVYDPALWECEGNNLVDTTKDAWDHAGEALDTAGDVISDGASAVYKAIKFW